MVCRCFTCTAKSLCSPSGAKMSRGGTPACHPLLICVIKSVIWLLTMYYHYFSGIGVNRSYTENMWEL